MNKDEALRIALEALVDFGWHIENCTQFPTWAEPKKHPPCTCGYDTAITALRQTLEQPEQEPVAWWNPRYGKGEYAFAEEQSPPDDSNDPSDFGWNIPLYTAPPKPAQDLIVGYADSHDIARDGHDFWVSRQPGKNTVPLYLYGHPPKIWQGLTDEEIDYIWGVTKPDYEDMFDLPKAIEAKLREKNGF